jgi:hypothetical protein
MNDQSLLTVDYYVMSRTEVRNRISIRPTHSFEILVKSQMPLYKGDGTSFADIDRTLWKKPLVQGGYVLPYGNRFDGPDRLHCSVARDRRAAAVW